jgi:hypothetical protein
MFACMCSVHACICFVWGTMHTSEVYCDSEASAAQHIHVYIHTYTEAYRDPKASEASKLQHTHTYLHTYIHTYIHTQRHTVIPKWARHLNHSTHTYIHTYIHPYTEAYRDPEMSAAPEPQHTHTYIQTYIHMIPKWARHLNLSTLMHTYIHTYIHRGIPWSRNECGTWTPAHTYIRISMYIRQMYANAEIKRRICTVRKPFFFCICVSIYVCIYVCMYVH